MLILTRKSEESVMIGKNIAIKVLKIDRNQVQLGFTAPKDVAIHRKEIYLRIEDQILNRQQNTLLESR